MATILVLGAGKSATVLIQYLIEQSKEMDFTLQVADTNADLLNAKTAGHAHIQTLLLDSNDHTARKAAVKSADIVISMLPPTLHAAVAEECLEGKTHLLTASYVDERMRALDAAAREADLLFLCETGLDPGIDHMSSMKLIGKLRAEGANISSFRSHCGGLVAPSCDNNAWRYKISWNPRNVVMAGKDGALYISNGEERSESYQELFSTKRDVIDVPGLESLTWYPNRDSIAYRSLYKLESCVEFVRTTLRYPVFIAGWKLLVRAGLTSTTDQLLTANISERSWWDRFNPETYLSGGRQEEEYVAMALDVLGRNSDALLPFQGEVAPATVLQYLLEKYLPLQPGDRDMIVMQHEIVASLADAGTELIKSSLVLEGDNEQETAMAKTVGLPLAVAALLLLKDKIKLRGVQIPILPEIYEPILSALEPLGINFTETSERQ